MTPEEMRIELKRIQLTAMQSAASSNVERAKAANAGTLPQPSAVRSAEQTVIDQTASDEMLLGSLPPGLAQITKFNQGVPFVGEYTDEVTGLFSEQARDQQRATMDAMDRQRPIQSTALGIAGGIVGGIPMAAAAGPAILAAAPQGLAARAVAGAAAGAVAGATEGAISGAGREYKDRGAGAARGAVLGGLFGAGAGVAAPLATAAATSIANRVKGMDVRKIAETLGIDQKAAQILKADLDATDFTAAQRNLDIAGPDAMIADASRPLREALDGAITGGGAASRIGNDAVSQRAAASGRKLDAVLNSTLGPPVGINAAARSISQRTAPARKAAYDRAYGTAIDYSGDAGRGIESVLARVPDSTMGAAIKEANEAMQAAGITNRQIMARIAPDGKVTFQEMPNVQQLDEIKKALGSVAAKEVDTFGRSTAAGNRAKGLARDLRDAVGEAVPSYKTAVRLGGDKIEADQALDMGRKLFGTGVTRENVRDTMSGASLEVKDQARQGVREYIDDTLARVRRSIDEPGEDTTETLKLLNILSSDDARQKLTVILGSAKSDRLLKEIDAAGKQFATRAAIATGSATGRREARRAATDDALAPGIIGNAERGLVGPTIRSTVQLLTRATPQAERASKQAALAQVAEALTKMRGQDAKDAMVIIERAIAGQPIKSADAARVGRVLGSAAALGGYQTASKLQLQQSGAR